MSEPPTDPDTTYLACALADDRTDFSVLPGSVLFRCELCQRAVYVMARNLALRESRGVVVVCEPCAVRAANGWDAKGVGYTVGEAKDAHAG